MIKNIIFDLCGPIITIDLGLMNNKFFQFGVKGIDNPYKILYKAGVTKEFEKNQINGGKVYEKDNSIILMYLYGQHAYVGCVLCGGY